MIFIQTICGDIPQHKMRVCACDNAFVIVIVLRPNGEAAP